MTAPVIGFAGMTHLGLLSAAASAGRDFRTICFDRDAALCDRLRDGNLHVVEPGLPELLSAKRGLIEFTASPAELGRCDVIYVAPDVPTDDTGASDLGPVDALLEVVIP